MSLRSFIHGLWYLQIGIEVLLACVLIAKKTWRRFPAFSWYVIAGAFMAVIEYAVSRSGVAYFYTYCICEVISIVLGLFVVREIFMHLFAPHRALQRLARLAFQVAVLVLVILGGAVIYVQSPSMQGLTNAILIGEEATRVVEAGSVMFLFAASGAFGLHWKQSVFGIALGLGIFSAVELVALAMQLYIGSAAFPAVSIARILAFDLSLFLWMGYVLAPERVSKSSAAVEGDVPKHSQLEQWNQAIMELISQ